MLPYVEDSSVKTSDNAAWVYALSVYLKAERQGRKADLVIKKTLEEYKGNSSMFFVFKVDAVNSAGVTVYSKACGIQFFENGTKYAYAEDVPIGTTVTVTERYPGAGCVPVSPTTYDAEGNPYWTGIMTTNGLDIGDEVLEEVPFVNKGSGNNGGGGVENTFKFVEGDTGDGYWTFISQNQTPGTTELPETVS